MKEHIYTTNLDYPEQFKLQRLPRRRNGGKPKPLQPLQVGEYVQLPAFPRAEEDEWISIFTYKVKAIDESNTVDLELIYSRVAEPVEKTLLIESVSSKFVK